MRAPLRPVLLRLAAYQLAFSGIGLAGWIHRSFGDTSLDQILWHLQYTEGAAVHMGSLFLFEFIFDVLVFPLAYALIAALVHTAAVQYFTGWKQRAVRFAPSLAGATALVLLLAQFSVFEYVRAQFEPDHFALSYVNPRAVSLKQEQPRNLILVYVESLEQTYGNKTLFGSDLLASSERVGGYSFPSYEPAAGAGWTIAAMVATQCGVPLKVYTEADVRRSRAGKSFLPGATCLGDVLQARGYRNVFMGGAPLSFAGKGAFLQDHGYTETWGREEWEKAGAGPKDFNEWGLWDNVLYARARKRVEELHAAGKPFNLTLLTMETHNPIGFTSPYCRKRGARDFAGVVACADDQLSAFVKDLEARGYLRDTAVVVLGDHLAMPNPVYEKLAKVQDERRIFNLFVADKLPPPNRQEILPFDLFPTLVELAGLDVQGDRLGLGYSAFGEAEATPPPDRAQLWSMAGLRGSPAYDSLWEQEEPAAPAASAASADAPD
ncbi:sulfatase-like hydrolase/transferase [Ramlibacter sp. G-1-2-2]|uniref:Sulfatase-like hydrolase/transferase n=1 Tax=Ramlibacter agri TaxID=2728837 RepID=A0A848H4Q7_9BURK|nr:sulfatase-like hydrolase/transferase [Ramlibacter agri]NML42728.1 sulfatase-like hydrolase/transferase [Ramlibacter agri]